MLFASSSRSCAAAAGVALSAHNKHHSPAVKIRCMQYAAESLIESSVYSQHRTFSNPLASHARAWRRWIHDRGFLILAIPKFGMVWRCFFADQNARQPPCLHGSAQVSVCRRHSRSITTGETTCRICLKHSHFRHCLGR